jgi:putative endonuclease
MYYTYILYSNSSLKYYCGSTQNLFNRLQEHNAGETKSIKYGIPWILIGFRKFNTRAEAMKLEKQIKNKGILRWLQQYQHLLVNDFI